MTGDEMMTDAETETNDFRAWMKALGFNAKQVTAAGETIGMSSSLAGHSSRGLRELTMTERLAMAAATAGLPAWTPDTAAELDAVGTLYGAMKAEIQAAKAGGSIEADAVQTIRAVIRAEALRLATEARLGSTEDPAADQAILSLLQAAAQRASAR
jgi:hypothetical protein